MNERQRKLQDFILAQDLKTLGEIRTLKYQWAVEQAIFFKDPMGFKEHCEKLGWSEQEIAAMRAFYTNPELLTSEIETHYHVTWKNLRQKLSAAFDTFTGIPVQQCGECGSIENAIVAQCMKCGCAVCEKCTDHEEKC